MPIGTPGGQYGGPVIEPYYPTTDPTVIDVLAVDRYKSAEGHSTSADNGRTALGLLTDEHGLTADDIRQQHLSAVSRHEDTSARHIRIGDSYVAIAQAFRTLQAELTEIAGVVDIVVEAIRSAPISASDKVSAIAELIAQAETYAKHSNGRALGTIDKLVSDLIINDGTNVILPNEMEQPAVFQETGSQPMQQDLSPRGPHAGATLDPHSGSDGGDLGRPQVTQPGSNVSNLVDGANWSPGGAEEPTVIPNQTTGISAVYSTPGNPTGPSIGNSIPPTTASPVGTPVNVSNTTSLVRPDASTLATPLTPQAQLNQFSNQFSEGLVQGMQNQVTMPVSPVAAAQPMQLDTHEPAATSQTSASAPAYAAAAPAPIAPVEQHAPMVAAPAPAPAIAAAPAAPVGQLPAYGADIRPATPILASAAAPPVPSTPAVASSVASAPTSASSSTALGQPAVVRHAPIAAPPTGMPVAGEAAFAAATSAVAGEVNHQAIEQARLHRLVDSIARQEPGFRWAIGEREDGSTLLVTDVACGWIPPGVEVPVGVEVLEPERRRGDLIALLGDASLTAAYSPGQYISQPDTSEPINMSTRSLHANPIKDLGWELGQATNWRDGLPQLAHTLAKAAAAGTGILDAEVDMLQQHLAAVRDEVMSTYPDHNPSAAENFMLLAAINALIAGDNRAANYHFAWFQAVGTTTPPL